MNADEYRRSQRAKWHADNGTAGDLDLLLARQRGESRRKRRDPKTKASEHETAVRALCASDKDLQREGFREAVLRKWSYTDGDQRLIKGGQWDAPKGRPIHREDIIGDLGLRPDAWKIVGDDELHCYEIIHTCTLTAARRHAYANLWFTLDCFYIKLRLFAADTFGAPGEVSVWDWWIGYALPALRAQKALARAC